MAKKWSELRKELDERPGVEEAREKAREELERELEDWAATLGKLRKARGFTQTQLAHSLGVSQAQVSRIENQTELVLSTLRSYIEAMGGRLDLIASFPDGEARVVDLHDLIPDVAVESEGKDDPYGQLWLNLQSSLAAAKATSHVSRLVSECSTPDELKRSLQRPAAAYFVTKTDSNAWELVSKTSAPEGAIVETEDPLAETEKVLGKLRSARGAKENDPVE